jgi:hypothetical protein
MNEPEPPQPDAQRRSPPVHSEQGEETALKALLKYNPDAINPRVFNTIPNFLGGTLYLLEHGKDREEEWLVLIKPGRAPSVYYDYEQLLFSVPDYRSPFSQIVSPDSVLALLSALIVAAAIVIYATHGTVEEPFSAALSAVLGFWFGKSLPTK